MLKVLFQYLTDSYALLENPIDNYIIMGVVGFVAFFIAYKIVGWFYDGNMISGSKVGSILHWIIRLIVFVVVYYVVATVIRIYKWITGLPLYVWLVFLVSIIITAAIVAITRILSWKSEKGGLMKDKICYVADNTVLNYPMLDYKYNRNTYKREKIGFWILSAVIVIGTILVIALSENETIKVLASALLGGVFSLVVWLLTIRQQDNMNYEIAKIETGIMCIDDYIESIKGEFFFVDPLEYKIIKSNHHDVYIQFMRQWQIFQGLSLDKRIDTKEMKVMYMNKKECTLEEFRALCDKDAENGFEGIAFEECKELIEYNYFLVNRELILLRKKLCRYKTYIYSGEF